MNTRNRLAFLAFGLTSLASAVAFAQSAPCQYPAHPTANTVVVGQAVYPTPAPVAVAQPTPVMYAQPTHAQPTYAQPTPVVYAQPTYAQPTYAQPTYAQPTYAQPTYAQPTYAQPTYAQPTYAQPTYAQPTFVQRRPQAAARFVYQLRTKLAEVDRRLRMGIARGMVAGQALEVFNAQRAQVEAALVRVTSDGVLAPQEQSRLERMGERCETLDAQYRVATQRSFGRRAWR